MTSVSESIRDLFADKGNILGTGSVVLQGPRDDPQSDDSSSMVLHHVDSLTYMDKGGHLHAVLLDTVTTVGPGSGSTASTVLEILSDVAIS